MLRGDGSFPIICRVMKIGVLDIQGSVEEHFSALERLASEGVLVEPVLVKRTSDFEDLDGLIIPGGESTTISKMLREYRLDREVKALVSRGGKIFGTCAGAIVLASAIVDEANGVEPLGLIDIDVERNAYGRQMDSFEEEVNFWLDGKISTVPAVFIRAPQIIRIGTGVKVLARFEEEVVAVREGQVLVTTFHPEMTDNLTVYRYFVGM